MIKTSQKSKLIGRTKMRMMYELEKEYEDVISFSVGEPNFHTPENICLETSPWSQLTPLASWQVLRAKTLIEKRSLVSGFSRPIFMR